MKITSLILLFPQDSFPNHVFDSAGPHGLQYRFLILALAAVTLDNLRPHVAIIASGMSYHTGLQLHVEKPPSSRVLLDRRSLRR